MLELALRVKGKSRFEFWILRIPAYGGKPRADTRFGRQLDRQEIPDYRFGLGRILPYPESHRCETLGTWRGEPLREGLAERLQTRTVSGLNT